MWMAKSFFALLVVGTIVNCVPTDRIDLPRAVSDFAADLYEQVSLTKSGNVIISPLSVATLLALLSQAANGRTYTELQHGLHLNNIDKDTLANQYYQFAQKLQRDIGSAQFNLANQIYVQQGHTLNRKFQEVAMNKFKSGVRTLNFKDPVKSAEIINRYVAQQTHGKIPKLVSSDSLSSDTDVFLVNAIYFKGKWKHPFNKTHTRKDQFHTYDKQTVLTEFMHMDRILNFVDSEELKASLVELKYADSKFSFVLVLPHPTSNLQQVASKIRHINLADVFNQMRPQGISLRLPKFKVEYSIQLKEILKQLGMGTMFSSMADLSGLLAENDDKKLYVSKVIHKAFIEVDEEGSTAGGSTGAEVKPRMLLNINANSPFMYYIRDRETNTIVFNGRIETIGTQ